MKAIHNSRLIAHRNPFGAACIGDTVLLSLDIMDARDAQCFLRIWIDGKGEKILPMEPEPQKECIRYSASLTLDEPDIVWYSFIVDAQGHRFYVGPAEGRCSGQSCTYDNPCNSYQLSFYRPRHNRPSWYADGIVYQIFPDRFARDLKWQKRLETVIDAEEHRQGPRRNLVELWDKMPAYEKDETGAIASWDFYGGSLEGIIDKLDYLCDLGITTIYLNPIFLAASNHRYDTADYMQIDPVLGQEDDFKRLCEKAAEKGISLVLDGVFNHTGCDSVYFNKYGSYPDPGAWQQAKSPWDEWYEIHEDKSYESWWQIADLPSIRTDSRSFQDFICSDKGVIKKWMGLGASGFRLDVAVELSDEFIAKIKKAVLDCKKDGLLIGEVWEDASNKISYGKLRRYLLGDELDCAMGYHLRKPLLHYLLGNLPSDVLACRLEDMEENYTPEAFAQNLNILGTHDTSRLLTVLSLDKGDLDIDRHQPGPYKLSEEKMGIAKGRMWLAVLLQMTLPGTPCIYYGDEAGVLGFADPYNRSCFPWDKVDEDCLCMYKNAIRLRQSMDLFVHGEFEAYHFADDVFGFERRDKDTGEICAVLVNRSVSCAHYIQVAMKGEMVDELISGDELQVVDGRVQINLNPLGSAVLYFHNKQKLGPEFSRSSGVLAHITSLPTEDKRPGHLGKPCYRFIDWLASQNQSWWQILPINPCDEYGSAYAGISAFAGNEQLIDGSSEPIDEKEFKKFLEENGFWLKSYGAYRALKKKFGMDRPWWTWPGKYSQYSEDLLLEKDLKTEIQKTFETQYLFQKQWMKTIEYAHLKGIQIIGDMPMYVASDSADVWAHQELFDLNDQGKPHVLAGAPPDRFCEEGQLWGNPVYRWDVLEQTGYTWWIQRFKRLFALYDLVRLDHFLGFCNYYAIGEGKSAKDGSWCKGPGKKLFDKAYEQLGTLPVIAEDLGILTPGVRALVAGCGFFGMDIMQFSDDDIFQSYTPGPQKICYSATHDNQTLIGYCQQAGCENPQKEAKKLIERLFETDGKVVICPLQDILGLGDEARMNRPGTAEGNWKWQASEKQIKDSGDFLAQLTQKTKRA